MAVTTEGLNARVFPIEQELRGLKDEVAALKIQISTRDADLENAERRFEELAKRMDKVENGSEHSDDGGGRSTGNIMKNPALRNLTAYTGDHRLYAKFRSKVRGILFSEDE